MSFLNGIRQDIERVLEDHETLVEGTLGDASKIAQSKTAQAALAALHLPGWTDSLLAEVIQELDNGFAAEVAKHEAELEAARTAAPAEAAPADPPADPTSPAISAGTGIADGSLSDSTSSAVAPAPSNVMP